MSDARPITLAKALSIRKRLAGRLAQARSLIIEYNSVLSGLYDVLGKSTVDVRVEYDRFRKIQDGLIVVKALIQRANQPIDEDLLQLRELRSLIRLLNELDTRHGTEPGLNGVEYQYMAVFRKPDVLAMVRDLEVQMDALQDRIDEFQNEARVEIPSWILTLAQ
ncbi:hypothetical protein OJF2_15900 [Aquisphaera giovannonii]|uniref:Uncharacterized protein n=1 Tax=Aquisphaera giovannonii TaxID=406548 RepID=A0A5B9VXN4_9BACT|nr:hypothetical protein [Aquisphaera giovannonii]QEH33093.1 hypothetical protein OJF2_15900 [Aquisphaera giovannonii]